MADTFSQIYIQIVFAVAHREALISHSWESQLYKYITGIVQNKGQKMLAINGMPNHIHFLIGMRLTCCLSDLVREVKKSSNAFINESGFVRGKFNWQEGFGAFSYSHSHLDRICQYVMNQKEHHRTKSFRDEYEDLLQKFQIAHEGKVLLDWIHEVFPKPV